MSGQVSSDRIKRIEVLLAMALARSAGSSGSAGGRTSFLWAPGGTPGEGVFTTWAALAPVLKATPGDKEVGVDNSGGAAHITAGAWTGITDVTFTGAGVTPLEVEIFIDDGATFSGTNKLTFDGTIPVYEGTTAPFISVTTGLLVVNLVRAGEVAQTGGQPFVNVGGTATLLSFSDTETNWAAGTINVAAAGATVSMSFFNGAILSSGAVTGGTGTLEIFADGASAPLVSTTQAPAPGIEILDPTNVYLLKPGATGTNNANVFESWGALAPVLALSGTGSLVLMDDSDGALHMTAGGPYHLGVCEFRWVPNATGTGTLTVDNGATFDFADLTLDSIEMHHAAGAAQVACVLAGAFQTLRLGGDFATFIADGAEPLLEVQSGLVEIIAYPNASKVGDGVHAAVTVDAGATLSYQSSGAFGWLNNHAVTGAGALTMNVGAAVGGGYSVAQDNTGGITLTLSTAASLIAYTPGTGTDYAQGAPTAASGALDDLAARVGRQRSLAATTALTTNDSVIWCNTTGGAFSLNLPAPNSALRFFVVDSGNDFATNHLTLHRHGAESINGSAADLALATNGATYIVTSDGVNWWTGKMVVGA